MAGNQREMQRKEKKAQKDRKNKTILWIVIAVIIAVLVIMKVCEININTVKENLTDSDGNFSLSLNSDSSGFPYSIDSSQNVVVRNINNKIGVLTPMSFTVLDTKKGKEQYTFSHGFSNPILKNSGVYALIYDQGAEKMRLDNTSENIYEFSAENDILCADVAKNGTVATAQTASDTVSQIIVYNESLKVKATIPVSYGYVVNIAVNNSGGKVAFVALNSEGAQLKPKLFVYSVGDDSPLAQLDLPSGNVAELAYSSDNLYVVADSYLSVVTGNKNLKTVFESGKINTLCYSFTPSDELIIAYNSYSNSTDNKVARVGAGGKVKKQISVKGNIRSVSAASNSFSVLTDSSIYTYTLGSMKQKAKSTVDDSVKSICRVGSSVYIHKQSIIDKNENK